MTSRILVDQEIRNEILTNLTENLCVEAGAGTGKTTVLVGRIVQILRTGHASIDEIAVITFTEKAAAELSGRIREKLEAAQQESEDPAELNRLEGAIRGLHRARIETIHAFATGLLRERPVEAGLDPGFEVLDTLRADLSFEEAFNDWRAEQLNGRPEALWRALNRNVTLDQVREVARTLHQHRDLLPLAPNTSAAGDTAQFVAQLERDVRELEGLLDDCHDLEDKGIAQINRILKLHQDCQLATDSVDQLERSLLRAAKLTSHNGANANWKPAASNARQKEICKAISDQLAELQQALRAEAISGLLPILAEFVQDYTDRRKRNGQADFEDLLIWTRDLLRDHLEVRRYFQSRFRCLLVDEFQDTDPLQVDVILYLTSDGQEEKNPRELRPSPGKLFVVGDPKQSIYRFRRADITIYEWVKEDVLRDGRRNIVQNFRSVEPVISWVNNVFAEIMHADPGIQPEYIALQPAVDTSGPARPAVMLLPGDGSAATAEEIRQQEAESLAALIHRAVREERWLIRDGDTERPARWRDVAILMPRRSSLDLYETALSDLRIPYRHEGGKMFFERQEVRELIACLRAIDDPTDGISLVAALRSGAFGCSDQEILLYVNAGGELDYREEPVAGHPAVVDALVMLRALHEERRQLRLPELIVRVLEATHLVEFALTLPQGDQVAANMLKVVDQARAFGDAHGGGLRAFVRWMMTSSQGRSDEADAAVAESGDDVVRLLTIHSAKGLEFPIVALANLNGRRNNSDTVKAIPDRDAKQLHLQVGDKDYGFITPGYTDAKEREDAHEEAQDLRLLYVAATRARDCLLIPAIPSLDKARGMLGALYPCLFDPSGEFHTSGTNGSVQIYDRSRLADAGHRPDAETASTTFDLPRAIERRAAWNDERAQLIARASANAPIAMASSVEDQDLKLTPEDEESGWRERSSRAMAVGSALHATMELIDLLNGSDSDIEAIAKAQAEKADVPDEASDIVRMARACLASDVMKRARRADRCMREIGFSLGLSDGNLVEGRTDLVFQEHDGLIIVDYKTNRTSRARLDRLQRAHRNQAAIYAFAVGRSTGLPVKEVVFVFPRAYTERRIIVDDQILADGERLAASPGIYGLEQEEDELQTLRQRSASDAAVSLDSL